MKDHCLIVLFCLATLTLLSQDQLNDDPDYYARFLEVEHSEHIKVSSSNVGIPSDSTFDLTRFAPISPVILYSHWDTLRVQAYGNHRPKLPIRIEFYEDTFHPPVKGKQVVTSRFGKRRYGPHRGIDIDLQVGDTVHAILDGTVRFVNYSPGHGRTVVVRHDNNLESVYAHLSEYGVKVNQRVTKGDYLGKGGKTGNARGSHLHLELRYQGLTIHPEYLLNFQDNTVNAPTIYVNNKWSNPFFHQSTRRSKIKPITTLEPPVAAKAPVQKEKKIQSRTKPKSISSINLGQEVHRVVKGDTLYSLARRYNSTVEQLCQINNLADPTLIKVGQNLKLR